MLPYNQPACTAKSRKRPLLSGTPCTNPVYLVITEVEVPDLFPFTFTIKVTIYITHSRYPFYDSSGRQTFCTFKQEKS
jgi:hypothetical protein